MKATFFDTNESSISIPQERPIVNNINWTVKKGEFWQLGPNGSGKVRFCL
jgi:ABC-type molybdenum transport system ATPase subunit/photorepair protein PhrA